MADDEQLGPAKRAAERASLLAIWVIFGFMVVALVLLLTVGRPRFHELWLLPLVGALVSIVRIARARKARYRGEDSPER